jgi:hypothetical protein
VTRCCAVHQDTRFHPDGFGALLTILAVVGVGRKCRISDGNRRLASMETMAFLIGGKACSVAQLGRANWRSDRCAGRPLRRG